MITHGLLNADLIDQKHTTGTLKHVNKIKCFMNIKMIAVAAALLFLSIFYGVEIGAQECKTWTDLPNKEDVINSHSIYRQALKVDDMEIALEHWKIAYENAPAADGQRDFHFMDGITIYKYQIDQSENQEEIDAYRQKIIELYEQAVNCYREGSISLRNCNTQQCYDSRAGVILGRMAYDMFYDFNAPAKQVYEASKRSINLAGNDSEYVVLIPAIGAMTKLYQKGKIQEEEARKIHANVEEIIAYNMENNETYAPYYKQATSSINQYIRKIERDLYDCDYFKEKLLPQFESASDDGKLARDIYNQLISRGCDEEDPDLAAVKERNQIFVDSVNQAMQADLEERNPAIAASRLYEEGDYKGAIEKYRKAVEMTDDPERKGEFYFRIASIQGRKLGQYSKARNSALQAANHKTNWGAPYLLIGDIYAKSSKDCGDSWDQRLAVLAAIDRYLQAARMDPEVAEDANRRAARYYSSLPSQDDAFMRGLSEGDRVTVDCWFNETVTLRFQ